MTVTAPKSASLNQLPPANLSGWPSRLPGAAISLTLLLPVVGMRLRRRRQGHRQTTSRTQWTEPGPIINLLGTLAPVFLAAPLLLLSGCGDRVAASALTNASANTYTITVTGIATTASGAILQHAASVTLNVE